MKPNTQIKDWRGRDFIILSVETVTGKEAAGMNARGWEPLNRQAMGRAVLCAPGED